MFNQQEIKELFLSQYFGAFLCFQYRKQNRTIINVGCHEPSFITFYANIFCEVITIDPLLSIKNLDNIENKTNSKIILDGVALGAMSRGDSTFYRCIEDTGISTTLESNYIAMREQSPNHNWEMHKIPIRSLDDLFPNHHKLDFLKIDAENEDINILVGAKNLIVNNLPIIQIEHDDQRIGHEILIYMGYEKIEPPFESRNSYYVHTKDMDK